VRRRLRLLHVHEQHARLLQLLISSEQVQSRNRALCLFTPLFADLATGRRSAAPCSRDWRASVGGSDRPISNVGETQFLVLFDKIGEARLIDDVRNRLADPAPETEERAIAGIFAFLGRETLTQSTGAIGPSMKRMISPTFSRSAGRARI